jgi:dTDP-4-dehydrorhamnose 3,5-epimerase
LKIISQPIPGVVLYRPQVHADERGAFFESASPPILAELGCSDPIVQLNVSRSRARVVRGLHYQVPPMTQGKLVRITRGEAFDVVVDLRAGSPTFGTWASFHLVDADPLHLWIPPGFAHGLCALADETEMIYGVTRPYSPGHERTLLWSDAQLGIPWPGSHDSFVLSAKDIAGCALRDTEPIQLDAA